MPTQGRAKAIAEPATAARVSMVEPTGRAAAMREASGVAGVYGGA